VVWSGQPAVGTTDRFDDLFGRLYPRLLGLAYRLLGERTGTEDVLQEAFLKLAHSPVLDRPDEEVAAWPRRVCLNLGANRVRDLRRARERLERVGRLEIAATTGDRGPASAVLLMALRSVLLVSVSLRGSTMLPTLTNGVVVFSLFGLAWLAGMVEFIGSAVANEAMVNLAITVSLLIPSDAVWRGASYYIQSPLAMAASGAAGIGMPFAANAPPTPQMIAWALAYPLLTLLAAIIAFARRDL